LEFYIRIGESEIKKSKEIIKEYRKTNWQYEDELMISRQNKKTNTSEVKERKRRRET